ncbi:exonuclease [Klebsiella phage KpS8]|jgi:hypothetical protein|uniref:Uncharacterized protein n=4 Tax=Mydovirus TaxID=2842888 RepID=A0A3G8F0K4_9CAUD|nr:exonuclease [Klebsiella phage vB_KpnM_KB57]YP_009842225.1 exonuclease [Proteus phage Mydo]YP_009859299.1 exonuclease [Klebsiella phage KpS8]YP_009966306.1 exonuclease [Klebsiella phage KNP2]QKE60676.1 hypothetical protein KPP_12631 [Klebsiella phage KPP-1]QOI68811.1 hypothetical protein phage621_00258 [Klebsiella phage vB_KpnM_Seu621]ALM02624.1 hypothetical protein KB57_237 [Klebsiella phage vB_KpnM_KB57]AZF87597.1 hypothetical protein CPT_Mydo_022 [Proteus phage Mydo]QIW88425.1 hypothet
MKVKMTKHYSAHPEEPRSGDILEVVSEKYNGSFLDHYMCEWKGMDIVVYPDECEEVR